MGALVALAKTKGCYRVAEVADLSKPLKYAANEFGALTCVGVIRVPAGPKTDNSFCYWLLV